MGDATTVPAPIDGLDEAAFDSLLRSAEAGLEGLSVEEVHETLAILTKASRIIGAELRKALAEYGLDHAAFLALVSASDDALGAGDVTPEESPEVNRAARQLYLRGMEPQQVATVLRLDQAVVRNILGGYTPTAREIVRLHIVTDMTAAEIARELGVGSRRVVLTLRRAGEEPRTHHQKDPVRPLVRSRMVALRKEGWSYRQIAEEVELPLQKVKNVLMHEGRKGRIKGYQGSVAS